MSNTEIQWGIKIDETYHPVSSRAVAQDWVEVNGDGEVVSREVTYGDWKTKYEYACFIKNQNKVKMVGVGPTENIKDLDGDLFDHLMGGYNAIIMRREIGEWAEYE